MRGFVKQRVLGSCRWMYFLPPLTRPPPPRGKTCPWVPFSGFIPLDRAGTGQRHPIANPPLVLSFSCLSAGCCFLLTWAMRKAGRELVPQTFLSASASGQRLLSPLCLQSHHLHSRPR